MARRIRDALFLLLPREWLLGGIGPGVASPGPPGVPTPHPPGPPKPPSPPSPGNLLNELEAVDLIELRIIAQLLLARLGGPVTLGEMEPKSMGEIDELESRLNAMLGDLQKKRAAFQSGGAIR